MAGHFLSASTFNSHWRHFIAIKLHGPVVHLRHGLNFDVVTMKMVLPLPIHVVGDVFGDELRKILPVLVDVVTRLLADDVVHFLVTVQLKRYCAEKTSSIFLHLFNHQSTFRQQLGELFVPFLPLFDRQVAVFGTEMFVTAVVTGDGRLDDVDDLFPAGVDTAAVGEAAGVTAGAFCCDLIYHALLFRRFVLLLYTCSRCDSFRRRCLILRLPGRFITFCISFIRTTMTGKKRREKKKKFVYLGKTSDNFPGEIN